MFFLFFFLPVVCLGWQVQVLTAKQDTTHLEDMVLLSGNQSTSSRVRPTLSVQSSTHKLGASGLKEKSGWGKLTPLDPVLCPEGRGQTLSDGQAGREPQPTW